MTIFHNIFILSMLCFCLLHVIIFLQLLASALCDFFEALELTENCYGIGHTAKMLASEVANLSAAKTKKVRQQLYRIYCR